MVVGAADGILLGVGQLPFDPIRGKAHFIEPGTACCPCGMWAVLAAPAQAVEHLAE